MNTRAMSRRKEVVIIYEGISDTDCSLIDDEKDGNDEKDKFVFLERPFVITGIRFDMYTQKVQYYLRYKNMVYVFHWVNADEVHHRCTLKKTNYLLKPFEKAYNFLLREVAHNELYHYTAPEPLDTREMSGDHRRGMTNYVQNIVGIKLRPSKDRNQKEEIQYLIQWFGFHSRFNTWEPDNPDMVCSSSLFFEDAKSELIEMMSNDSDIKTEKDETRKRIRFHR